MAEQRKYSVAEIDKMRCALQLIYWIEPSSCEERLRTYMLNGTDPAELEEIAQRETVRRGMTHIPMIGSMAFDFRPGALNRVG